MKDRVTKPVAGNTPDVVNLETEVAAVQQKNYDLMGDLLEADVLILFRQVLREEESLVKVGGQAQFGYLPTMALANIGAMNAESFCERILSCASLVVNSHIEASETRITKELRDKAEVQAQEASAMDEGY